MDRHRRTGGGTGPIGGRVQHRAHNLVPEYQRIDQDRFPGRPVGPVVQVRPADPAIGDLDDRLVARGRGFGKGFDPQIVLGIGKNTQVVA